MKITPSEDSNPDRLLVRVQQRIQANRLLQFGEHVVVAVSGGPDSLALLDILRRMDFLLKLTAVYVDHGLRPAEIKREILLLENYCQQFDTAFVCRSINVTDYATENGMSIEEAARILRYQALREVCRSRSAPVIATGHTADDQVEEFFIRLVRGGSAASLGGMDIKKDNIIRPLLHEKKETLIRYLQNNSIAWCTDSSNEDRKFLRNRIRLDVLPLLQNQLNPAIHKTVLQSMDILKTEDSYLEAASESVYREAVEARADSSLSVDGPVLLGSHLALRRRVIERCFWAMRAHPNYRKINAILNLLEDAGEGSELHLEKKLRVKKKAGNLLFFTTTAKRGETAQAKAHLDAVIPGPGNYNFQEFRKVLKIAVADRGEMESCPGGSTLYADEAAVVFPLRLRSVEHGDRFHPFNAPGKKKVSRFFTDRKIPVEERGSHPVLTDDGGIIALLGLQIDNSYKITDSTEKILKISWNKL